MDYELLFRDWRVGKVKRWRMTKQNQVNLSKQPTQEQLVDHNKFSITNEKILVNSDRRILFDKPLSQKYR